MSQTTIDNRRRSQRWLMRLLWIAIVADALYVARFALAMMVLNWFADYDQTAVLQLNSWNWVEGTLLMVMLPGEWPEILLLMFLVVLLMMAKKRGSAVPQI